MSWVLLDDNFPNHPKAVQAGPVAAYLFVCGLCYCRRYNTGGFIPAQALPVLGVPTNAKRLVEALIGVGLWDAAEGGYQVHDYSGFYADEDDKQARRDAISQARSEAGRKGVRSREANRQANAKQNTPFASCTDGIGTEWSSDHLLEEKKREADFGNFWAAYPRKDGKQAARIEWLRLKLTDDEQKAIAADLNRRGQSAQWLKDGGQFIPHARTYLHQRRWEDGFEERPRLSERTINVIKGFGEGVA